jgi:hypothetical protein
MARQKLQTHNPKAGDRVLIRMSSRSPYAGQMGVVVEINDADVYGAILVRFSDGLQFRYTQAELLFLGLLSSHLTGPARGVA